MEDVRLSHLSEACRRIGEEVRRDPRYAHTSHLRVHVGGEPVFDEHYRGATVSDVFSVTKAVVATVTGIAVRRGLLTDLDEPLHEVLPELRDTPSRGQTWRHLLTMTRGAAVDGPWDVDEVTALPGGQVAQVAAAPRTGPPGREFRYDNGAYHLLSAGLARVLGRPVAAYAEDNLFAPLGIRDATWLADPDGVSYGFAHLRLSAEALGKLGELWRTGGQPLVDPAFAAAMASAQSPGGAPEEMPYGFGTWIGDGWFMAAGWAGQHVVVTPDAVVVVTGDPGFRFGPPASDELHPGWRSALDLVRQHVLPVL